MKKYVTKRNYPLWLILLGFVSAIVFMTTLDHTPSNLAPLLGVLLFVGDGSLIFGSAVLVFRAIRGALGWVKSAENKKERQSRTIGLIAGLVIAAPFVFYWFVTLSLAAGFLSIAHDDAVVADMLVAAEKAFAKI